MGHRLSKIYTRTGDDGSTSVEPRKRILKNSLRIEALGTLDELNCAIGLALSFLNHAEIKDYLTQIQHELFDMGGELCPPFHVVITAEKVLRLEQQLDKLNEALPPLKEFILPRGNAAATHCHFARAVCRRAERVLVGLHLEEGMNPEILRYINRLSDFLFVVARVVGDDEVMWERDWG